MVTNYLNKLLRKSTPRWIVFLIDLGVTAFSFVFSFSVIRNLKFETFTLEEIATPLALIVLLRAIAIVFTKSYKGIIRYTSIQDAIRIFLAVTLSTIGFILVRRYLQFNYDVLIVARRSIIILDYFICLVALTSLRILYKVAYAYFNRWQYPDVQVTLIYGAGRTGLMAKRSIDSDETSKLKVAAFIDDQKDLTWKSIEGLPIYSFSKRLQYVVEKYQPKQLIIADPKISPSKKKKLIEEGLKYNLIIKNVPPIESWINGEFSFRHLEDVDLADLLGRPQICLDNKLIKNFIHNKTVLITGAAGSIGSEIAKQCLAYKPKRLILLDQAETPLFELEYKLDSKLVKVCIGDVADVTRMKQVFQAFRPDIVYHAAAYKHVPLMEDNPYEAFKTNICGTRVLAKLSVEYGVTNFVYVSTDKAVNPTNIMGASKRIGEIYVQSYNNLLDLQGGEHTKFVTTRFGNVLGSNGSVIPRFQQQIAEGGPITVTHEDVTRFFMTKPEACQLVLEASTMGEGGEIYIFDMGASVRIVDLAKKMIMLSGFKENEDIEIEFTGLRPGEKIHEELLHSMETNIGTHHPKIMVAKVQNYEYEHVDAKILSIKNMGDSLTNRFLVSTMKELVPEFISHNSVYQELDQRSL